MSIITPTNFNVQAQSHIDSRLIQADITARNNIATPTRYWGMQVHVLDSDGSNNPNTYILQKGLTSTDISDDGNWLSSIAAGSTNDIQFKGANGFTTDVGFYYDPVKDMLVGGTGGTGPDFTGAHAQAGSWSLVFGEDHNFNGAGRAVNSTFSGWHINVGSGTNDGASSAALGVDLTLEDSYTYLLGFNLKTTAQSAVAIGGGHFGGGGLGDATRQLIAGGVGAINISHNTSGSTPGVGAFADYSSILGGTGHNIPVGSTYSSIIGGNNLSMPAATLNMVLVPNLMINPTAGDYTPTANGQIWYNSTTNKFRIRQNGVTIDLVGDYLKANTSNPLTAPTSINTDSGGFTVESAGSNPKAYMTISSSDSALLGYLSSTGALSGITAQANALSLGYRQVVGETNLISYSNVSTGWTVQDEGNDVGLYYAANYSTEGAALGGDGARWIPDKGYNDSAYLAKDPVQEINTAHVQLTQAQVDTLNASPITIVAAPAVGQYIQVIGASAKLTHVTAAFTGGDVLQLRMNGVSLFETNSTFITAGVTNIDLMRVVGAGTPLVEATALVVQNNSDSSDGGASTIDVYVQYVIIDTN